MFSHNDAVLWKSKFAPWFSSMWIAVSSSNVQLWLSVCVTTVGGFCPTLLCNIAVCSHLFMHSFFKVPPQLGHCSYLIFVSFQRPSHTCWWSVTYIFNWQLVAFTFCFNYTGSSYECGYLFSTESCVNLFIWLYTQGTNPTGKPGFVESPALIKETRTLDPRKVYNLDHSINSLQECR